MDMIRRFLIIPSHNSCNVDRDLVHTPSFITATNNPPLEATAISVGSFGKIASIAFDPAVEGTLYWLESDNGMLKKLDFESGRIKTITTDVYDADNLQYSNG